MFWLMFLSYLVGPIPSEVSIAGCCIDEPKEVAFCLEPNPISVIPSLQNTSATLESSSAPTTPPPRNKLRAGDTHSRFQIGVHEVLVPVAVTDGEGHPVRGLKPEEFRIFEDGTEQQVDFVLAETTPLTVGIVVDMSGSMDEKMESTRMALSRFIEYLEPGDQAFILAFDDFVQPVQDLTNEHRFLLDALSQLEPDGGTALYDAIVEGLYKLHQTRARKRALVVLSDGMDNVSINSARDAIGAAKASGIPIYTIGLGKKRGSFVSRLLFSSPLKSEFDEVDEIGLRELASKTGGRALFVTDLKRKDSKRIDALGNAFELVAKELRSLYLLSYRPMRAEMDGRWHNLEVKVLRENLYPRFRPSYLAAHLQ